MAHIASSPSSPPPARLSRPVAVWLLLALAAFVLFFAAIGIADSLERWYTHVWWIPFQQTEAVERAGPGGWDSPERRADMERRVNVINQAIPAIEGELQFLNGELKKAQARAADQPEYRELAASMRRQMDYLEERIAELRSDRDYYLHELHEK